MNSINYKKKKILFKILQINIQLGKKFFFYSFINIPSASVYDFKICFEAFSISIIKTEIHAIETPKEKKTVGCVNEKPFIMIFLSDIPG